MSLLNDRSKSRILTIVLVLLCTLFLASLFMNIGYPLFWADESMTVMGGVRVLEFGYPKVHDGRNVFYDLMHPNASLGIDERTDAYIGGASWGQYYFAVPGIKLAEMSDDLFTKTGVIRATFALVGLAGLVMLALLGRQFFHVPLSKTGFLTLFVFFELISVPLVLHLREARYYPLTIFLTTLTIYIYARYRILAKSGYRTYAPLLCISLFLMFVNFSPVYFIFFGSFFMFESLLLMKHLLSRYRQKRGGAGQTSFIPKEIFKEYVLALLPVVVSLIVVSPLISFFKTFYIAEEMAKYNALLFRTSGSEMYLENLSTIWRYFASSDFIYLAIFSKICLVFFLIKTSGRDVSSSDRLKGRFSGLMTVIFIVYVFLIARIPNFPFTRYLIPLQPLLALMIILDLAVVYNLMAKREPAVKPYYRGVLVIIFIGFVFFNISRNYEYIKGHLYEMTHQYKGPLDYVIPYIKERYPDTKGLVIATNYEETSFMYYLGSKVTIGFVGNNMEQDSQIVPDIIFFRKWHPKFSSVFKNFFTQREYELISFPVADYPVNNIAELNWAPPVHHLFETVWASHEMEKGELDKTGQVIFTYVVDIYVRK
jgi:hypothetical protein